MTMMRSKQQWTPTTLDARHFRCQPTCQTPTPLATATINEYIYIYINIHTSCDWFHCNYCYSYSLSRIRISLFVSLINTPLSTTTILTHPLSKWAMISCQQAIQPCCSGAIYSNSISNVIPGHGDNADIKGWLETGCVIPLQQFWFKPNSWLCQQQQHRVGHLQQIPTTAIRPCQMTSPSSSILQQNGHADGEKEWTWFWQLSW